MISGTLFADVSHYHPLLDAKAYKKAGASCIGVKICEGGVKDSTADASVAKAEAEGLVVIGYVFGRKDRSAIQQADDLIKFFPWKPGRIWAFDEEDYSGKPELSVTHEQAIDAINHLKSKLPKSPKGLEVCHYHNITRVAIGGTFQWVARYGVSTPPPNSLAWQFFGGIAGDTPHIISGVKGPVCDMNKLICSINTLRAVAGLDNEDDDEVSISKDEGAAIAWWGGRKVKSRGGKRTTVWHPSDGGDHQSDFEAGWDYQQWLENNNLAPKP